MILPTANTPGYGLLDGHVACDCLIAWTPSFQYLCELMGYGTPKIWQCTGDLASSAGVHGRGGAIDFGGLGNARARLAREAGAWATWPRDWPPPANAHTHCVLANCPHNDPARYQLYAVRDGYDGLGTGGRDGIDPLKGSPTVYRTWQQGLAWMKSEINRIEEAMYTDADRARDVATQKAVQALQAQLTGFVGTEAARYGYYAGKFNEILTEMAKDDQTPVTIDPANVQAVADALASKVVASLPKAQ